MVLFPSGGLGRLLLVTIAVTTLSYLVLNIVSFGGNRWITYVDVPIRFGLWKVCDTTSSGFCNDWSDTFISNNTNQTFDGTKPDFIQASQALEIISLMFYIIAAGLILVGIINLDVFSYEKAFILAAGLLFICITFLSGTLGLMSAQGRANHPLAFLDWAWWNGLAGLIMTIICCFSLLAIIVYLTISTSSTSGSSRKIETSLWENNMLNGPPSSSMGIFQSFPEILPENMLTNQLYNKKEKLSSYSPMALSYGNQHSYDKSPSPIISSLVQQYLF